MSLPKILLLHGALGAASQFDQLKQELGIDYELMAPDFPGHGGRLIPESPFSFSLFTTDVIRLLNEKQIGSIDIFGYSMGGYAALWMAKNFPNRVNRIFTLATKMEWNEAVSKQEASMLDAEKMKEKIPAFAAMLERRHQPEDWVQVVKKTAEMMAGLALHHLKETEFRQISHAVKIGIGNKDKIGRAHV